MSYEGRIEHICEKGHHWSHDCYEECNGYWTESNDGADFIEKDEVCPYCQSPIAWTGHIDDTNGEGEEEILQQINTEIIDCPHCEGTGKQELPVYKIPKSKCPICGGSGIYISEGMALDHTYEVHPERDKCATCNGTGMKNE